MSQQPSNDTDKVDAIIHNDPLYLQGFLDGVKKEREACAEICEDLYASDGFWCARAIRLRNVE